MSWVALMISAAMEAVWATALGNSAGFTDPAAIAVFSVGLVLSIVGLGYATTRIPISTAYAVWTGTGAALTVAWAMVTGAEQATIVRVVLAAGIVVAVVGLKLVDAPRPSRGLDPRLTDRTRERARSRPFDRWSRPRGCVSIPEHDPHSFSRRPEPRGDDHLNTPRARGR